MMLRLTCVLLLALLATPLHVANATAYRSLSAAETLLAAESVVLATVVDTEALVDGDLIWTLVRLDVETDIQASSAESDPDEEEGRNPEARELELRFLGGALADGRSLLVAGMPTFVVGERVLLALHGKAGHASPLVGFEQGLWRLDGDGLLDSAGFYLGLEMAAGATGGTDSVGSGTAEQLTLARSDTPTGVGEVLAAIAKLRSGDTSLARAAAEDPRPPQSASDGSELATPLIGRYRVEEFGGPMLIGEELAAAVGTWTTLAPEMIRFVDDSDATTVFAFGAPELFDEDTFALTLVGDGVSQSLISPAAEQMLAAALRHELGLVLGLPESVRFGPLTRALSDPAQTPGELELAALVALANAVQGDLNGDGRVDFQDLLAFATRYGRTGLNDPADLDRDGVVADSDLELLRSLYEFLPPGTGD